MVNKQQTEIINLRSEYFSITYRNNFKTKTTAKAVAKKINLIMDYIL